MAGFFNRPLRHSLGFYVQASRHTRTTHRKLWVYALYGGSRRAGYTGHEELTWQINPTSCLWLRKGWAT